MKDPALRGVLLRVARALRLAALTFPGEHAHGKVPGWHTHGKVPGQHAHGKKLALAKLVFSHTQLEYTCTESAGCTYIPVVCAKCGVSRV